MRQIGNMMRSAALELSKYIIAENDRLEKTIHSQMDTPPDYNDQQTCQELIEGACAIDDLAGKVLRYELALSKIESWDQHDIKFTINQGSNGERELYRSIARRALKVKESDK